MLIGAGFEHVVYTKRGTGSDRTLRIYFEGDGRPWVRRDVVASDPTAHRPLALELMLADPSASAYVSRPCYQSAGPAERCTARLWTMERYGEQVVASMSAIVGQLLDRATRSDAQLVGYSGGGVLALLVAERVQAISTVVTIAANLDVATWAALHGYSPLEGSLDPATVVRWREDLRQIHYAGADDENVPPSITRAFVATVPTAESRLIRGYDHRCCWTKDWPTLVAGFANAPR
jgi:pimeloyl-ACP methyl ester carboxylesterase